MSYIEIDAYIERQMKGARIPGLVRFRHLPGWQPSQFRDQGQTIASRKEPAFVSITDRRSVAPHCSAGCVAARARPRQTPYIEIARESSRSAGSASRERSAVSMLPR